MVRHLKATVAVAALLLLTAVLGAASANAASPTLTIDPVNAPGYTSAEVTGTVDPGDADAPVYLEYTTEPSNAGWTEVFLETIPANAGPIPVSGEVTGLKAGTEYFVRFDAYTTGYNLSPEESFTTLAVGPPAVSISAPTQVTASGAHFSGTVDPDSPAGNPSAYDVNWAFECTPACPGAPSGTIAADNTSHSVEGDVSGLKPGTAYEVRLVATNAGAEATAGPEALVTLTRPPKVLSVGSAPLITEATLHGQIDPGGLATTYHFEYGPTAAYGQSTPARTISGGDPAAVTANLFGLSSSSSYYYRLVVASTMGTDESASEVFTTLAAPSQTGECANEAIRQQQKTTDLPDCMAYELVSPSDKNGGTVLETPQQAVGLTALSRSGETALYSSYSAFAGAETSTPSSYIARRTASGWVSQAVSPTPVTENPNVLLGDNANWFTTDPELTAGIASTRDGIDPGDSLDTPDLYALRPGSPPELLTQGNEGQRTLPTDQPSAYAGMTPGAEAVFFLTPSHLVPADSQRLGGRDLYLRSGGVTTLVQERPDGTLVTPCGSTIGGLTESASSRREAFSDGGLRVVFTTSVESVFDPECETRQPQIFLREPDGQIRDVSASQATNPDPNGEAPAIYLGATPNQSTVIFRSTEMLTDDASPGGGIYAWDRATGKLSVLVSSPDIGIVGISNDADEIYFISASEILAGADIEPGETGLYVVDRDSGSIDLVAKTSGGELGSLATNSEPSRPVSLDNDGDVAFVTAAQLTDWNNQGLPEVYFYRQSTQQLVCASCDPAGQRPAGSEPRTEATLGAQPVGGYSVDKRSTMNGDGSRLVFSTGDQLVPGDTNRRRDAYMYYEGRVWLISGGTGDVEANPVDISESGNEVMFSTYASLVPQDRDGGDEDVYVARVDGGFLSEEPTVTAPCSGEGCQSQAEPHAWNPPASQALNGTTTQRKKLRKRQCRKARPPKHRSPKRATAHRGKAKGPARCGHAAKKNGRAAKKKGHAAKKNGRKW